MKHAEALVEYWWAVYNLAHRQVHNADREAKRTEPVDAQRAIFQTVVVMLEIEGALPIPPDPRRRRGGRTMQPRSRAS